MAGMLKPARPDSVRSLMTALAMVIGMLPMGPSSRTEHPLGRRDRRPDFATCATLFSRAAPLSDLRAFADRNTARCDADGAHPPDRKLESHEESKPPRLLLIGLVAPGHRRRPSAKASSKAPERTGVARWTEQQAVPDRDACQARARRHQPASDAARHDPGLLQGGDLRPGQRLSEELDADIGPRQGRAGTCQRLYPALDQQLAQGKADLATATANAQLAADHRPALEHTRHVAMGVAPGRRQQERRGSLDEGRDGRGQR